MFRSSLVLALALFLTLGCTDSDSTSSSDAGTGLEDGMGDTPPDSDRTDPDAVEDADNDTVDDVDGAVSDDGGGGRFTPVYITVASHLEERFIPNCNEFELRRDQLFRWAEMFDEYGAPWNIQPHNNFTEMIELCETDEHRRATGGKNLLRYLFEDRSIEFDAHGHEQDIPTQKNLTDIREGLHRVGGIPYDHLTVVGGFDSRDQEMFEEFIAGRPGRVYPDAEVWRPELLTFSAIPGHGAGEDFTGGIWNPVGLDHPLGKGVPGVEYYQHNLDSPLTLAGGGVTRACQHGWRDDSPAPYDFWEMSDYDNALVDALADGTLPQGEMTAATFYIRQAHLIDPDKYLPQYESQLQEMKPNVDEGKIIYVHFQELLPIWTRDYERRPNLIRADQMRSRATCSSGLPTLPEDEGETPEDERNPGGDDECGECDEGQVCEPRLAVCVPDCRESDPPCPMPQLQCDMETGLCVRGG